MKKNIELIVKIVFGVTFVVIFLIMNKPKHDVDVSKENNSILDLKDGRQCYTYDHEATKDEPYTVNEFIDFTITGDKVTGTKHGTQKGPDITNGYEGTIEGTLENNTINNIFSYTIEGSKNKEMEIYKSGIVGIEKLRYPLIEKNGILTPDTTKDFETLSYARVGCTASN